MIHEGAFFSSLLRSNEHRSENIQDDGEKAWGCR